MPHKSAENIFVNTHSNGFRHVYQQLDTSEPTTYIYLYCGVGSAMDPPNLRGVSHFIEHMCFKGTHTKPKSTDFIRIFDRAGAYFNAFTVQRFTGYVVKCHHADLEMLLHTLSDGVLNSIFNVAEYKKELKVVVEESVKLLDDYESQAEDHINKMVYAGTPFEHPVDCYEYHQHGSYSRESVMDFYKKWYQPSNMVLSVCSNIPYKAFQNALKGTYFLQKEGHQLNPDYTLYTLPTPMSTAQYKIASIDSPKTSYVSISFRVCANNSPDKHLLDFLAEIFSGHFISKLYVALREDNGLTYYSNTYTEYHEMCGDFTIVAVSDVEKLFTNGRGKKGVIPIIIDTVNDILRNGPSKDEMDVTKMNIQRSREISQLSDKCAEHNGEYVLLHPNSPPISYQEFYEVHYKNITAAQIQDVARKWLSLSNMSVCVLGKGVKQSTVEKECNKLFKYC